MKIRRIELIAILGVFALSALCTGSASAEDPDEHVGKIVDNITLRPVRVILTSTDTTVNALEVSPQEWICSQADIDRVNPSPPRDGGCQH
jgi:hypothetical protein